MGAHLGTPNSSPTTLGKTSIAIIARGWYILHGQKYADISSQWLFYALFCMVLDGWAQLSEHWMQQHTGFYEIVSFFNMSKPASTKPGPKRSDVFRVRWRGTWSTKSPDVNPSQHLPEVLEQGEPRPNKWTSGGHPHKCLTRNTN